MTDISPAARFLLSLSHLPGVGPATLKKALSIPRFDLFAIDVIAAHVPAISKALNIDGAWERAQENTEMQMREAQRYEARILCVLDPEYPKLLAQTRDDPLLLFVRGALAVNPANSVAIIGTREPTVHGMVIAKRITQFFAEAEWSIVSGLAIGCDSLAHETALDAGAHTVAILAHGLQMIAPARNRQLAERILSSGGALVSEYPFGREVQKQQYVKRDRTQAGMAQGVVMIQSDLVGGSLHASRAALEYKRWLAVPYPTDKDRERNEPKIQANLLIADGDDEKRADLLRCPSSSLSSVLVLKSREDYLLMKQGVEGIVTRATSRQVLASQLELLQQSDDSHHVHTDRATDLAQPVYSNPDELVKANSSNRAASMPEPFTPLIEITARDELTFGSRNTFDSSNSAIAMAVSARVAYLQTRHAAIQQALTHLVGLKRGEHHKTLLFAVDDFVAQMGHTAELLVAVHSLVCKEVDRGQTTLVDSSARLNLSNHDDAEYQVVKTLHTTLAGKIQTLEDSSTERLIRISEYILLETNRSSRENHESNNINEDRYGTNALIEQVSELCSLFNELVIICYGDV